MKKKSRAEHIRHFPLLQGCCPQKSSLCSAASPPVPCQRARSTAGGGGRETQEEKECRCQEIHPSQVRKQERACRAADSTAAPVTRKPSPLPPQPGSAWAHRTTCPRHQSRGMSTPWGRRDGLQAKGQVYKAPGDPPNSVPYRCSPAISDVAACGHLTIPASQGLSAPRRGFYLQEFSGTPSKERRGAHGRGCRRIFIPVTHRAHHPSHCATDT